MRFMLNTTFVNRLCVVDVFGYICFGIMKFYEDEFKSYLIYSLKSVYLKGFINNRNFLIFLQVVERFESVISWS